MTPVFCEVRHDPPNSYGDCVRACVASMLDYPAKDVPHFYHDNCDGEEGTKRIRAFLAERGFVMIHFAFAGSVQLADILAGWAEMNPGVPAILFGGTESGDHCVIMQNGKVEHNPAWYQNRIIGPNSGGTWNIVLFIKA
ncbi:hypothetical protein HUU40_00350 [candidate division KSB1 bacterium]|nr:hypothetical protein [candidate division KSB1 bacterium]